MELNEKSLGLSAAVSFATLWVICSAFVAISPSFMMGLSGHMIHAGLEGMNWTLTMSGFLYGLVLWSFLAGVSGWLIGYFYNRFNASK